MPQWRYAQRLTQARVNKLTAPSRYRDGAGLFLQVDGTGARRWGVIVQKDGKRHALGGIGTADKVPLAAARLKMSAVTSEFFEKATNGKSGSKRTAGAAPITFKVAAERLIANREKSWRNPKSRAGWVWTLEQYVYPSLGAKPIVEIEPHDIRTILLPIWEKKAETAGRVLQRLAAVFTIKPGNEHAPK